MLTREQILGSDDRTRREVKVPEWGGSVYVGVMNANQREAWEVAAEGKSGALETLVVQTVCDEAGRPVFAADDLPALREKNGVVMMRLARAALQVNKLTKKDIEELEKNSEATPSDS
jgi:hypothetical protein